MHGHRRLKKELHTRYTVHVIRHRSMMLCRRLSSPEFTDNNLDFSKHEVVIYKVSAVSSDGMTESMGTHEAINHASELYLERYKLLHAEKDVAPYYNMTIKNCFK